MKTKGHILSSTSQTEVRACEAADRPVVGLAQDYPSGLFADFHSHPGAQLLYAVSGVMKVETRSTSFIIPPSTALILPANTEHSIFMDGPVAMRTLFLREPAASRVCHSSKVIAVTRLLRELIVAACSEPLDWDLSGRGRYIIELALDEIERSPILPVDLPMAQDSRLRRVVDAVRTNPADNRCLSEWSEMVGASERTLARLFRSETGLSFRQWRQQARLTAAMSSLSNGCSPVKAASIAGFNSQSAFGAAFRKFFGITPGKARTLNLVSAEQAAFQLRSNYQLPPSESAI